MGYKKPKRQLYTQTRIPVVPGPRTKTITAQQFVKGSQRVQRAIKKAQAKQHAKTTAPVPWGVAQKPVLLRDSQGYYAKFPSKSAPTKPPYTTRIWTAPTSRFKIGDVSCDCPGWIYNHKCHHTKDIVEMLQKDPTAPPALKILTP